MHRICTGGSCLEQPIGKPSETEWIGCCCRRIACSDQAHQTVEPGTQAAGSISVRPFCFVKNTQVMQSSVRCTVQGLVTLASTAHLSAMDTRMPAGDEGVASPAFRGSTLSYTASATSGDAPVAIMTPFTEQCIPSAKHHEMVMINLQ